MGEAFKVTGDPHKKRDTGWLGDSALYRLDPAFVDKKGPHAYCIVSAVEDVEGIEAVAVSADAHGHPTHNWNILGVQDGSSEHDKLLDALGYPDVYEEEL